MSVRTAVGLRLPTNASRAVDDVGMTTRWECCAYSIATT